MYSEIFFYIIEFTAFILPALPNSLTIRLFILLIYFIAHYFRLQVVYSSFKNNILYTKDTIIKDENSTYV
jgi:hypothetical protein